jgi:hypothetical protein
LVIRPIDVWTTAIVPLLQGNHVIFLFHPLVSQAGNPEHSSDLNKNKPNRCGDLPQRGILQNPPRQRE